MKPLNQIIEENLDEEETLNLEGAIADLVEAIESSGVPATPGDNIAAFISAQKDVNLYLGRLVLEVASDTGTLVKSFDEEIATLSAYLDFTILSALYQQVAQRKAASSGLHVITGEHPPLEGLT